MFEDHIKEFESVCQEKRARLREAHITGEWDDEPDREEFQHAGFPCLLSRSAMTLTWCGYVGVPVGHPLHGKGPTDEGFPSLNVHGGVTYTAACFGVICHKPNPGESDDVWWIGFDCAHASDVLPLVGVNVYLGHLLSSFPTYKPIGFVRNEVKNLAEQLAEFTNTAA